MKASGLTEMSPQGKPVLGFTDTETVKLDFDDTTFKKVKYWTRRAMNWFNLAGYIILKSSKNSYHVIFDRPVSWAENLKVVAWVALQSQNGGLTGWLIMQCIKKSSTLRVSNKKKKHSPRIVYSHGKQEKQITGFLRFRKLIKRLNRKVENRLCKQLVKYES